MGQTWCKEKTTKAQDSKSPLDRVFVRCAHRIYPGLKEEGSVLGGATQRVTSSEIGYAGSPPREVLTRGTSIDSVDRPFHPSDWVDVNLEVPSTPRASPVLTNLTVDTSPCPAGNVTSVDSTQNRKNTTPVPPPRRRKRNKGRPLPPKPDETVDKSSANQRRNETGDEPLYSSVRSPRSSGDEQDPEETGTRPDKCRLEQENAARDGRKTKEIYEHKVNGTGRIIPSDVVSGRRVSRLDAKKNGKPLENGHRHRRVDENEEYERFASSRTSKHSSTPNREDTGRRSKEMVEKQMKDSSSGKARTKNYSTVSLPNYDELDASRHRTREVVATSEEGKTKPRRPVRSSTGSLPFESFLSPFSEKTSVRLEDYIPGRGSPYNLSPYQLLEKLHCGEEAAFVKYEPASKSPDWDLGDIGNCELNHRQRRSSTLEVISGINDDKDVRVDVDEDVVDFSTSRNNEGGSPADPNVTNSPVRSRKDKVVGRAASPVLGEPEYAEVDPNRSAEIRSQPGCREPPPLVDSCNVSSANASSPSKEPFFLDEEKHRSALDAIGGNHGDQDANRSSSQSLTIFARSLSNESEPNEHSCETKELRDRASALIRSISEESLPTEMLDEQEGLDRLCDEKLAKDTHNKLKKSLNDWRTNTPPPSPEPRNKSEAMDIDHSTLLKVLKDEAAEGSNFSSMTPSLTELEAALSDMLEKEESPDASKDEGKSSEKRSADSRRDQLIESERNPEERGTSAESTGKQEAPVFLGQILKEGQTTAARKVSFCSWEEAVERSEASSDLEFTERSPVDLDKRTVSRRDEEPGTDWSCPTDPPPEKPSRLNRSLDDTGNAEVPTPPKRRNKSVHMTCRDIETGQNAPDCSNDRLI